MFRRDALLAEAASPLSVRLLRINVDVGQQLLVAGDRMGNVLAFHLPPGTLLQATGDPLMKISGG